MIKSIFYEIGKRIQSSYRQRLKLLLGFAVLTLLLSILNFCFAPDSSTLQSGGDRLVGFICYALLLDFAFAVFLMLQIIFLPNSASIKFPSRSILKRLSIVFFVLLVISVAAEVVHSLVIRNGFNIFWWLFFLAFFSIIYFLRKYLGNPAKLFLSVSLISGIMLACVLPVAQVSFDDQVHYAFALNQSFVGDGYITEADQNPISIKISDYFDSGKRSVAVSDKNEDYWSGYIAKSNKDAIEQYARIGHIPSGIFLFIGRALHLPFTLLFIFGRIANVLLYSLVTYLAIKKLVTGKYIMAVIALCPSLVYFSANYNYDTWVAAFLFLGFSYFFSIKQRPLDKIKYSELFIMLMAFFFAVGPKAIYFPIMFVLYFIGRDRFYTSKICTAYRISISVLILFAVISMALPLIFSSGEAFTDMRGGETVDTMLQIKYILANPIAYAKTFLGFASSYCTIPTIAYATTFLAHIGGTSITTPLIIVLMFTMFTDRYGQERGITGVNSKIYVSLFCGVTIALAITSIFLAYNPVGARAIEGFQPRYMLPLLFPIMMVWGSSKITNAIRPKTYSLVTICPMTVYILFMAWHNCVMFYQ